MTFKRFKFKRYNFFVCCWTDMSYVKMMTLRKGRWYIFKVVENFKKLILLFAMIYKKIIYLTNKNINLKNVTKKKQTFTIAFFDFRIFNSLECFVTLNKAILLSTWNKMPCLTVCKKHNCILLFEHPFCCTMKR